MGKKSLFIALISLILLTSFARAYVSITDVKDLYNLGDKVYITATIKPDVIEGTFEINLICEGKSMNIERFSAEPRFVVGEEAVYSTFIKLSPEYIGDLKDKCNVKVSLGQDQVSTKTFVISDKIITTTNLDKLSYNPRDMVILTLEAKKENGELVNGFLKISGMFNIEKPIKDGKIIEKLSLADDTPSGTYNNEIIVYDLIGSTELNKANASFSFSVNQIPREINNILSENEIMPGKNLTIKPEIIDQANKKIDGLISIKIVSPDKKEIKSNVNSGESIDFYLPFDLTYGTWKIISSFSDLTKETEFIVIKNPKISFNFVDNVLIVKNIGNDIYNGKINVKIGDQNREVEIINLKVGGEEKYSLEAPNGEYSISVSDGTDNAEQKLTLTGAVIGIDEFDGPGFFSKYPFVWGFILILFVLFTLIFLLNLRKTPFKLIGDLKEKKKFEAVQLSEDFSLKAKNKISEAEHSLVLKGEKQSSSVISIKIENFNSLSSNTKKDILKIIRIAEDKKGAIEKIENSFLVIFSPLTTRSFSNESDASNIAFKIYKLFVELNNKVSDKFSFGIGLNNGDLISNTEEGKLKYTSIGNTILLAKKMADLKQNKVYASEDFRKKLMRDLRVEKAGQISNIQIYSILYVSNRSENESKLDDLLKRMQHS